MNTLKRIIRALFPPKLTQEEKDDIEFCRKMILTEIQKTTARSYKVKDQLGPEIITSLIYLKIFASWLKNKKFRNIEEAWRYMNDIKGIIEKVFYITNYVYRVEESNKAAKEKATKNGLAAAGPAKQQEKNPLSQKPETKVPLSEDYLSANGK